METENKSPATDYTVPLVEDFFTAKAVLAKNAALDVTFSNGETFSIEVRKK